MSFTVEVVSADQSERLSSIQEVEGYACEVHKHPRFNHSKGIVYIKEFDITDIEDFKAYFQEN